MPTKSFSFGKNWMSFVKSVDETSIERAKKDIIEWLGTENVIGKRVIDIGSGSGIHSLCFNRIGAGDLFSFDYDIMSVEATKYLKSRFAVQGKWHVEQGSILDEAYLSKLGKYDIVYSWGVLHHTGNMWEAIRNAGTLVKSGGLFYISIYAKGPNYEKHLDLKRRYNGYGWFGRTLMIWGFIWRNKIFPRIKKRKNPFRWNKKKERGMNVYHDVVDWLGGYPYEVASEEEITGFLKKNDFELRKKLIRMEGGCHCLLYEKL